jgi:SAM-dependent methyltransferase
MTHALLEHWQTIYRDKGEAQTSWSRAHLDESLRLIDTLRLPASAAVIDVGAGRSTLVDDLLARGFADLTVLDLAPPALAATQARLGRAAARVQWLAADVLDAQLPAAHFGLWHDRAVFHFLIDAPARQRYVAQAARSVRAAGYAIIATFAADGPERCSALPVRRYDCAALAQEFAAWFEPIDNAREEHVTPWGAAQAFTYVVLRRTAAEFVSGTG